MLVNESRVTPLCAGADQGGGAVNLLLVSDKSAGLWDMACSRSRTWLFA